jgi:hypothetical protein
MFSKESNDVLFTVYPFLLGSCDIEKNRYIDIEEKNR